MHTYMLPLIFLFIAFLLCRIQPTLDCLLSHRKCSVSPGAEFHFNQMRWINRTITECRICNLRANQLRIETSCQASTEAARWLKCAVFPMSAQETELECVLSSLSALLSALILLAPVNFSFWFDLYQHPPTPHSSLPLLTLRH